MGTECYSLKADDKMKGRREFCYGQMFGTLLFCGGFAAGIVIGIYVYNGGPADGVTCKNLPTWASEETSKMTPKTTTPKTTTPKPTTGRPTFTYAVNNQIQEPYFNASVTMEIKPHENLLYYMEKAVDEYRTIFTGFKATYFAELGFFIDSINKVAGNFAEDKTYWQILNSSGPLDVGKVANGYLKSKWRQWFGVIDAQHKHQFSNDDLEEQWNRFAIINHLEGEKERQIIETIEKLVKEDVFYGKPGPISEEEFIEMQNEDFKANKEGYIAKRRHYFTTLFNAMHIKFCCEGVTEDEFVNAFKALGHDDVTLGKQFFHLYNVVDGKVSLSDIIDSWVQFTTCEDSSKPDIVKAGLNLGI